MLTALVAGQLDRVAPLEMIDGRELTVIRRDNGHVWLDELGCSRGFHHGPWNFTFRASQSDVGAAISAPAT